MVGAVAFVSCGEDETVRGSAAVTSACLFDSNEAIDGGGVYSASGFDHISDSTFVNNFAGKVKCFRVPYTFSSRRRG